MKGRIYVKCRCKRLNLWAAKVCTQCGAALPALKKVVLEYPCAAQKSGKRREALPDLMTRKGAAETELNKRLAALGAGAALIRRSVITLEALARAYFKDGDVAGLREYAGRKKRVERTIGRLAAGLRAEDLTMAVAREYRRLRLLETSPRTGRRITPATVNRELAYLSVMLAWGAREQLITANPLAGLAKLKGEKRRDRICTPEELTALGAHLTPVVGDLVRFLYHIPMRLGEVLAMDWDWIDLEEGPCGTITVPEGVSKSGDPRMIPLIYPEVAALLARQPSRFAGGAVWLGKGPRAAKAIGKGQGKGAHRMKEPAGVFRAACAAAGVDDLRLHDLKHTAYTNLIVRTGLAEWLVQYMADHKGPKMARHYLNLKRPAILEAARRAELDTPVDTPEGQKKGAGPQSQL